MGYSSFAWNVSWIHMWSSGPISHLTDKFICGHPLLHLMSNCWEILKTEFSHLHGVWVLRVRNQRLSGHREGRRSRVCSDGRCAQWWMAGRGKRKREEVRGVKCWKWDKSYCDIFSFCRCWILERFAEPYPLFCNIFYACRASKTWCCHTVKGLVKWRKETNKQTTRKQKD